MATTVHNNGSDVLEIAADTLIVDKIFQRHVTKGKVNTIARNFSWKAFGIPVVAPRRDGTNSLLDGQTRHLAMILKFGGTVIRGKKIMLRVESRPCRDLAEEARIFTEINLNQKNLSKPDFFHAGIAAGDPEVKAILSVLLSNGLSISYGRDAAQPNQSRCAGVFMDAYERLNKTKFNLMVQLLATCYVREDGFVEPQALKAAFLRGLLHYLEHTSETVPAIRKLLWNGKSATDIVAAAQQDKDAAIFTGWKRPEIVARHIGGGLRTKV